MWTIDQKRAELAQWKRWHEAFSGLLAKRTPDRLSPDENQHFSTLFHDLDDMRRKIITTIFEEPVGSGGNPLIGREFYLRVATMILIELLAERHGRRDARTKVETEVVRIYRKMPVTYDAARRWLNNIRSGRNGPENLRYSEIIGSIIRNAFPHDGTAHQISEFIAATLRLPCGSIH